MPTRHGPRHGRATDERWRRTAARTGLEGRSASAGRDRRNRRARIALTAFSEPGWCPDTPPLKRHRGRRWRFSAVRSTNVGSRPALCTAAPPLLPALADHLPVCGSPALATIRSDGELRNGNAIEILCSRYQSRPGSADASLVIRHVVVGQSRPKILWVTAE